MFPHPSVRVIIPTLAVVGLVVVGIVAARMAWPFLSSRPSNIECSTPLSNLTAENAAEVMRMSYNETGPIPRSSWRFTLFHVAKFCESTSEWWSSKNQTDWERLPENEIPGAVKSYAEQANQDLFFYVIRGHQCCFLQIDDGWVDAASSKLVSKVIVGL